MSAHHTTSTGEATLHAVMLWGDPNSNEWGIYGAYNYP